MAEKKQTALRHMTSELDRAFAGPFGSVFGRWPFRDLAFRDPASWTPEVDVFERDNRLVTRVDLPGLKKEDVKVEVSDGCLSIAGERKSESEEKKDNVYRSERAYGSFVRVIPLPDGARLEDVRATFADGVLEVSVSLPPAAKIEPRTVPIGDAVKAEKSAA